MMNGSPLMPLALVAPGERAHVTRIEVGGESEKRLIGMGVRPGCEVEMLLSNGGSVVLVLEHSRIALSRALAQKILVSPA